MNNNDLRNPYVNDYSFTVDIESDLRGINRHLSKDPAKRFIPGKCKGYDKKLCICQECVGKNIKDLNEKKKMDRKYCYYRHKLNCKKV
jgi:hypothetical protein